VDKPVPEEVTIRSDADTIFDPRRPPSKIHELRASYSSPLLLLLWEQRAMVRRAFVYALLTGTVIALLIPNLYTSRARIMPPDEQGGAAMLASLLGKGDSPGLSTLAQIGLGQKTNGALYAYLLHSRTVQDRIVERFELQKEYSKRYRDDAIKKLDDRTDVDEDRKSGVITIDVSDRKRERARQMALAYIDELNRLLAEVSTSAARRERIFVEQRLVGVQKDLQAAEKDLSEFSSKTTVLDVKEQTKAMVESEAMMQAQLIVAESELQGLEQIYTPSNVRVRSVRARVEELRRQLHAITGSGTAEAGSSGGTVDDLYPTIRRLPILGVTWVDLYRRARIQEAVFELLTKQYELARIQEAKEIPTIKVVDVPELPEKKSFPPRLLIICLFAAGGILAAVAWIIFSPLWQSLPPSDPGKRIVQDMTEQFSSSWRRNRLLHLFKSNGHNG
jgi:capsule polysaccharide export protein KpsE/RkpR